MAKLNGNPYLQASPSKDFPGHILPRKQTDK